jgi:lipopolysaccharide transport system ATP-binding protein
VDEVLAVGDTSFQKKCLAKIASYAQAGRTVLFVSHNLDSVRSLCKRGVWLKDGRVNQDGKAEEVIEDYFNDIAVEKCQSLKNTEYGLSIQKVLLKNDQGRESNRFLPGEDLSVEIHYEASKNVKKPIFAVSILGSNGPCFASNMLLDGHIPDVLEGCGTITCTFRSIPLLPQNYSVKLSVRTETVSEMIIAYQEVAYFVVAGDLAEYGYKGAFDAHARYSTGTVVPHEWRLPDGSTIAVSLNRQTPALSGWER